jgi:hypothetical protein
MNRPTTPPPDPEATLRETVHSVSAGAAGLQLPGGDPATRPLVPPGGTLEQIRGTVEQVITDLGDLADAIAHDSISDIEALAARARRLGSELTEASHWLASLEADPLRPYRERWEIVEHPAGLMIWTATRRDGSNLHAVVAPDQAKLASRLHDAEREAGQ